jgi:excisionase family DNA binding protein
MAKFYTPEEVAEELRVTRRAVYGWLKDGRLPGYRAGNRWRIDPADVQAFLQAGQKSPVAGQVVVHGSHVDVAPSVRAARASTSDGEAQARAARVRAGRGVLAHASITVDEYLRWKREDVERENQQSEQPKG